MAEELPRTITLRNGVELPAVGLGTFKAGGADVKAAVHAALRQGIQAIDTASIYKASGGGVCLHGRHPQAMRCSSLRTCMQQQQRALNAWRGALY